MKKIMIYRFHVFVRNDISFFCLHHVYCTCSEYKKFLLKKGEIRYDIYKIRCTAEETKLSVFRSIHAGCEEVPAKENG